MSRKLQNRDFDEIFYSKKEMYKLKICVMYNVNEE